MQKDYGLFIHKYCLYYHLNILNTSFFAFARFLVKCDANISITIFSAKRKYMFICCFCRLFCTIVFIEPRICKRECFGMAFIYFIL